MPTQVHPDYTFISRRHAWVRYRKWGYLGSFPCDHRCETRLCACSNTLHPVICTNTGLCPIAKHRWSKHSLSKWRWLLQPASPPVLHQGISSHFQWFLVCGWLCSSSSFWEGPASAAKAFGLTVSIKKTEVLRHLAPNTTLCPPNITTDGEALENVIVFKYLGSSISSAANLDDEVLNHLSKASQAFGRLPTRVWQERGIKVNIKVDVYKAVVLSSLLYGCETSTCYRHHIKKLEEFHLRCLRKILRVGWDAHIPNQEILRRTKMLGIEAHCKKAQLRWCGYIACMEVYRLPKQLFFAELSQGKRHMGGQKKRYKDTLKASLKTSVPINRWQDVALNSATWWATINKGTIVFESDRLHSLDEKRMAKKNSHQSKEFCNHPQYVANSAHPNLVFGLTCAFTGTDRHLLQQRTTSSTGLSIGLCIRYYAVLHFPFIVHLLFYMWVELVAIFTFLLLLGCHLL